MPNEPSAPPPAESDLAKLIGRAKAGEEAALNDLCRRCYPIAHDFLAYLIPEQADDLTQELFAGLGQRLVGYEESGRFIAWLRSVAFNLFRTRNRSIQRRREDTLACDFDIELTEQTSTLFTTEKRALRRAVLELPASLKVTWELYAEGYEPREIAVKVGITPGAAATRVSRAKTALEQMLAPKK